MKTAIRAIETEYAGCRFRSRLEARWAVFFSELDIKWQYEVEGFELKDGTRYLPDFYLPETNAWVEVKGREDALRADLPRLRAFVRERTEHLLILGEVPIATEWDVPAHGMILSVRDFTQDVTAVVVNTMHTWAFMPFWAQFDDEPTTEPRYIMGLNATSAVCEAYKAARSARFEFGERG